MTPLVSARRIGQSQLVTAKKKHPNRAISVRAMRLRYDLLDPITTERAIVEICNAYREAQGVSSGAGSASELLGIDYRRLWDLVRSNEDLAARVGSIRRRFGTEREDSE